MSSISSPENLAFAKGEMFTTLSAGYSPPPVYSNNLQFLPGVPPFTINTVDAMVHDYQVKLALSMRFVPIMKPQFALVGDPEIVAFVEETMRKIWTAHIIDIAQALPYTRFGGEVVYRFDKKSGLSKFDKILPFHPRDFRVLTRDREIVGLRIVSSWNNYLYDATGQISSNMDAAGYPIFAPKSLVYVHGQKHGSFEGTSVLEGSYEPWLEKVREGGGISSRSMFFYKAAYDSGIIYHPPGAWENPVTHVMTPYSDIAIKMLESIRNGTGLAMENLVDDKGAPAWRYEKGTVTQGGEMLLSYVDHLDHKIILGAEIPDDVISQNSGTGSYAGRTIPFIAFLESGTPTVRGITKSIKDQTLTPLVITNFGEDRADDWDITEAKVNVDQFLGGGEGGEGAPVDQDGDNDGIPNEAGMPGGGNGSPKQMSQAHVDKFVEEHMKDATETNRNIVRNFGRFLNIPPEPEFRYEGRRRNNRIIGLPDWRAAKAAEIAQLSQSQLSHDVSSQPRDEAGRWTAGGGSSGSADTKDTKPRESRPHVTETPQFKKWFGDSKVVDDSGKPRVVYRGTQHSLDGELGKKTQRFGTSGATFFSSHPDVANSYASIPEYGYEYMPENLAKEVRAEVESMTPSVSPTYLKMSNPLVVDGHGGSLNSDKLTEQARSGGYDGLIMKNVQDTSPDSGSEYYGTVSDVYAVFEPHQIKSAIGNRGTFDPSNPAIHMSFAGGEDIDEADQFAQKMFNWDEEEHPRDDDGKFTDKSGSGSGKSQPAIIGTVKSVGKFSANHKPHRVNLPENRSDAKIEKVIAALDKSGFHVGSEETDKRTGKVFRYVSNQDGDLERMSDSELTEMAYSLSVKNQKSNPDETESGDAGDEGSPPGELPKDKIEDIQSVMGSIEPGAWRGALVSSRELRKQFPEMSKEDFDSEVVRLGKEGVLSLHLHDYVHPLSEAAKDEMVSYPADPGTDKEYRGRCYVVGVALRQNSSESTKPAKPSTATDSDTGPAGVSRSHAIQSAKKGKSQEKGLTHEEATHATYIFTGTGPSSWSSVKVTGMDEVEGGKPGDTVMVPKFEMPKGYETPPLVWEGGPQSACCGLCGHDIKNVYYIQNDEKKWIMPVGSECVTKFGEGKSGEHLAKAAEKSARRDSLKQAWDARKKIGEKFGTKGTDGEYRIRSTTAIEQAILQKIPYYDHQDVKDAKAKAARILETWNQLRSMLFNSSGAPVAHEKIKIGNSHYDESPDSTVTSWSKRHAKSLPDILTKVDELTGQQAKQMSQFSQSDSESSRGHWITIGGHSSKGEDGSETKHSGGTRVFIGRNGKILKGPAALKGENVGHIGRPKPQSEKKKNELATEKSLHVSGRIHPHVLHDGHKKELAELKTAREDRRLDPKEHARIAALEMSQRMTPVEASHAVALASSIAKKIESGSAKEGDEEKLKSMMQKMGVSDLGHAYAGLGHMKGIHKKVRRAGEAAEEPIDHASTREGINARRAHAKAEGKTGRDYSEAEARKIGSREHIEAHGHARDVAKQYGVSTHDVLQNMRSALKYRQEMHGEREAAKDRARKILGLNAGNLAAFQNRGGRDYSTIPGFDTAARSIAIEHPELGFDPDDTETSQKVFDFIREGKTQEPKLHDRETAELSAEWVHSAKKKKIAKSDHDDDEDTSFNFGFGSKSGGESGDGGESAGEDNGFDNWTPGADNPGGFDPLSW